MLSHPFKLNHEYDPGDHDSECTACKIDPVVVQPFPAADMNRLCAAGMEWMFLRLFFVGGAVVHGLHGRAEERVEEGTGEPRKSDQ